MSLLLQYRHDKEMVGKQTRQRPGIPAKKPQAATSDQAEQHLKGLSNGSEKWHILQPG
jgi:hypothetical protein